MENPQDKDTQDPEEKKLEEEALKETPEDEIKGEIIEDLGLDEETQAELIGKLVERAIKERKITSTAIKQKIRKREELEQERKKREELEAQIGQKPAGTPQNKEGTPPSSDWEKKLDERLTERELNALDVPDDIKKDIKLVMERDACSLKKAMETEFIKFQLQKHEEAVRAEEASANASPKGQAVSFSNIKTEEDLRKAIKSFDMSKEEDRKKYHELMSKVDLGKLQR